MRERKQRSLHCSPKEQTEIRVRASAAGKTVTRYVLDLALADDPNRHPLVLTAGEQREQLGMLRHCDGVMRMLRKELLGWKRIESVSGACGPGTEVGAMRQPRRRRKESRSLHLSISATDEEWEIVRRNAARRRKSIARYLVGLALGEDSTAADSTGPEVALDPVGAARRGWIFCGESTSMPGMRIAVR